MVEQAAQAYRCDKVSGVLTITFTRPKQGNAIPASAAPGLAQMFREARDDTSVRVILVRAEGKVFSAGADRDAFLRSIEQTPEDRQADFRIRLAVVADLVKAITAFDRPVVVAMNGAAAGGGLLYPLAADFVIANSNASFLFAHQRAGLSPDCGVSYLLPQLVGPRVARKLLLSGASVDAAEALLLGLVDSVVPPEDLDEAVRAQVGKLAGAPQRAVRTAKKLVQLAASGAALEDQLAAELAGIVDCVGDEDFVEGVQALVEQRSPRFPSVN